MAREGWEGLAGMAREGLAATVGTAREVWEGLVGWGDGGLGGKGEGGEGLQQAHQH